MLVGRRLVKLRQVVVDADRLGAVRQRLGQSFPRARGFAPGEGRPAFEILHAFATYAQGGGLLREIARLLAALAALSLHRLQIGDGARARGAEDRSRRLLPSDLGCVSFANKVEIAALDTQLAEARQVNFQIAFGLDLRGRTSRQMARLSCAVCGDGNVNSCSRCKGDEKPHRQLLACDQQFRLQAAQASDLGVAGRPQSFDRRAHFGSLRFQRTGAGSIFDGAVELSGQVLRARVGSQRACQHALEFQLCQFILFAFRHRTRLIQKPGFFRERRCERGDVLLQSNDRGVQPVHALRLCPDGSKRRAPSVQLHQLFFSFLFTNAPPLHGRARLQFAHARSGFFAARGEVRARAVRLIAYLQCIGSVCTRGLDSLGFGVPRRDDLLDAPDFAPGLGKCFACLCTRLSPLQVFRNAIDFRRGLLGVCLDLEQFVMHLVRTGARGLAFSQLLLHFGCALLRNLPIRLHLHPWRCAVALALASAGKRFVHLRLRVQHHQLEQWVLRHRLQRFGESLTARLVGIVRQPLAKNANHVALFAKQRRGDERFRYAALAPALSARCIDTPAQQPLQLAVHLAALALLAEGASVFRELEVTLAATAKRLAHPPDVARLLLERQADGGRRIRMPVEQRIGRRRCGLQQQHRAYGPDQARLTQLVGAVQNVEPGAKFNAGLGDSGHVGHVDAQDSHGSLVTFSLLAHETVELVQRALSVFRL